MKRALRLAILGVIGLLSVACSSSSSSGAVDASAPEDGSSVDGGATDGGSTDGLQGLPDGADLSDGCPPGESC
jgi:hypothetical protein